MASKAGVSAALLRKLARALVEAVRATVISKPHYAQLERDAKWLHAVLPRHVRDADALRDVESSVAEFLQSASERVIRAN